MIATLFTFSPVFSLLASVEGTTVCLEIPLQPPPPLGRLSLGDRLPPPHLGDRCALTGEIASGGGDCFYMISWPKLAFLAESCQVFFADSGQACLGYNARIPPNNIRNPLLKCSPLDLHWLCRNLILLLALRDCASPRVLLSFVVLQVFQDFTTCLQMKKGVPQGMDKQDECQLLWFAFTYVCCMLPPNRGKGGGRPGPHPAPYPGTPSSSLVDLPNAGGVGVGSVSVTIASTITKCNSLMHRYL